MNGIPFRNAHEIVGRIVAYCIEKGKDLQFLTMEEFKSFSEGFNDLVYDCLSVGNSVNARNISGGTSKEMVLKRIEEIEKETQGK
jgi:argininosuccinate lyase